MVGDLVLPAPDLPVFVDTGDGDEATLAADPVPERTFVLQDLFRAGVDHAAAHILYLLGGVHVFGDDAPFKIFTVVVSLVEDDYGIAVIAKGHEMDTQGWVEHDLAVMGEIREIVVYELQG